MITIDVRTATDERELHALLKRELGFPAFYGMNWDAFWDAVTGLVEIPEGIRFTGWEHLAERVPRGADMLRRSLDDYRDQYCAGFISEYA
ncbi:barstar family protein [Streptomyces beijiangensis]|uniref:Barstar family protein n=1 Tax=Streptomyces beijiangensis TaxID=163361 RepID=A0A939F6H3_9ACTN|nr:barstar family protein [Streptomyces beijiangensis]MBO0512414.1 barstar family protein [Streptomyces beijiangensis]